MGYFGDLDEDVRAAALTCGKGEACNLLHYVVLEGLLSRCSRLPWGRTQVKEKIKYAKWKTVDILTALRDGRVPQSGPVGGDVRDALTAW